MQKKKKKQTPIQESKDLRELIKKNPSINVGQAAVEFLDISQLLKQLDLENKSTAAWKIGEVFKVESNEKKGGKNC